MTALNSEEEAAALALLQALLRFKTTSHSAAVDGQYTACADFLLAELHSMGIASACILPESLPGKPVVVAVLPGADASAGAILLNSHYDVVPVVQDDWTVDAFGGQLDEAQGRIYGRGAQDMKCVVAGYLAALRHLLQTRARRPLKRTVLLTFVPDEEIGGAGGMNVLMSSDWWHTHASHVDLALDEGLASEGSEYHVFYGERLPWWVYIESSGLTGHGSRFIDQTAVGSVVGVVNKALAFREAQRRRLHGLPEDGEGAHGVWGCSHSVAAKSTRNAPPAPSVPAAPTDAPTEALLLGDVTSLNVTMLQAGMEIPGKDGQPGAYALNVVPAAARAAFDIRIPPSMPSAEMHGLLDAWCEEVSTQERPGEGGGSAPVTWRFAHDNCVKQHCTSDTAGSPWWALLQSTLAELDIRVRPSIFPAATDSRFLRAVGYQCLGFSPIRNSPVLLHENDEYIGVGVYLEGVGVYVRLIQALAEA